jgi:hypothetical protein
MRRSARAALEAVIEDAVTGSIDILDWSRALAKKDVRLVKGVRLDLSPGDHERLERVARERGLTMSSYARMKLLECIKADEARG